VSGPLRPTFSEGQILGAADLNAQVDYERLGAVLHERTEHLWGVAQGLVLTTQPSSDSAGNAFVGVTLSPGRAVDPLGRAIVVTAPLPLQPSDFTGQIANPDKTRFYPVFVQAIEVPRAGDTQPGKCGVTLTTRVEESQQISYGTPGSEISVLDQELPTVDEGLGTPTLNTKVLVGWVQFDITIQGGQFIAVNTTQANGVSIRYVGVVASDVVAGGGVLTLHTRPAGQRFMLSITENSTGGAMLAFGQQNGSNPIVPTFSVDEKGNINYSGALQPAPIAKTLAESGSAFDGVKLQPPAGVVDSQKVRLHVLVTPLPLQPTAGMVLPSGTATVALPFVETCAVAPDLTVSSSVRWVDASNPANFLIVPAACNYLIVATGE
jgi:hypothetical protein